MGSARLTPLSAATFACLAALCFVWGVATVHFQVWPYGLLKLLQPEPAPINVESLPYNQAHRSTFDLYQRPVETVFLGDSITQFAPWHEMFPSVSLANRGIGGERFDNMVSRLDDVIALEPETVFIMGGVNGAGSTPVEQAIADLETIVERLRSEGIDVALQTAIVPRGDARDYVLSLNGEIADMAERRGLELIDLSPLSDGNGLLPEYSLDGTHLTGAGYKAWESILRPYVTPSENPPPDLTQTD